MCVSKMNEFAKQTKTYENQLPLAWSDYLPKYLVFVITFNDYYECTWRSNPSMKSPSRKSCKDFMKSFVQVQSNH